MSGPTIYLALLISTLIGAAFHLLRGGTLARMLLYVSTAWVAFFAGNWVSHLLHWELGRIGNLNLFPAILATLIGLVAASILAGPSDKKPPRPRDENEA
ncbi:MAG TPA: hypothetical protein VFI11_04905 [Anaerolineales bacterium]|nr:hypothetical protein [Anaerolineales bacterium]